MYTLTYLPPKNVCDRVPLSENVLFYTHNYENIIILISNMVLSVGTMQPS